MKFRGVSVLILAASLMGSVSAQDYDYSDVFRTPAPTQQEGPAEPVATTLDAFQFNGVMRFGGKVRISVYDTKSQKNVWLSEGQTGDLGLSFSRYDENNETVVLMQGGIMKKLSLNQVKIDELKIAPSNQPPPPPVPSVVASQPANERVESDEEARKRIQRVAEEIRRRRAERRRQLEEQREGR